MLSLRSLFPLIAFLSILLGGCAKVGDPLPPVVTIPETISDLRLAQEANETLHFLFQTPSVQIARIELYRACNTSSDLTVLSTIDLEDIDQSALGGIRRLSLKMADFHGCRFAFRFLDQSGHRSRFSNIVETTDLVPASPPRQLTAETFEEHIQMTWAPPLENLDGSTPPRIEAYLVNWKFLVTANRFEDRAFEFGTKKEYFVQTVSRTGDPMVLSRKSENLEVTPEDTFPPGPPTNLEAIPLPKAVQLLWDSVEVDDLSGYQVYRRTDGESFQKLSPLVSINRYFDQSIPAGVTLEYIVTAIDDAGNESTFSSPASVSIEP